MDEFTKTFCNKYRKWQPGHAGPGHEQVRGGWSLSHVQAYYKFSTRWIVTRIQARLLETAEQPEQPGWAHCSTCVPANAAKPRHGKAAQTPPRAASSHISQSFSGCAQGADKQVRGTRVSLLPARPRLTNQPQQQDRHGIFPDPSSPGPWQWAWQQGEPAPLLEHAVQATHPIQLSVQATHPFQLSAVQVTQPHPAVSMSLTRAPWALLQHSQVMGTPKTHSDRATTAKHCTQIAQHIVQALPELKAEWH